MFSFPNEYFSNVKVHVKILKITKESVKKLKIIHNSTTRESTCTWCSRQASFFCGRVLFFFRTKFIPLSGRCTAFSSLTFITSWLGISSQKKTQWGMWVEWDPHATQQHFRRGRLCSSTQNLCGAGKHEGRGPVSACPPAIPLPKAANQRAHWVDSESPLQHSWGFRGSWGEAEILANSP